MKKRLALVLALVLCAAMLLAACGGGNSGGGAGGDSLVFGMHADATKMDPVMVNDITSMALLSNIFEPLVRVDTTGEVVPGLAESWEISDDGLAYTFKIATGVKYHNGEDVTTEDVAYSVMKFVESEYSAAYMNFIERVDVVDESTVTLVLKYPYAPCLSLLGSYSAVFKESFYEDGGDSMARNPIGCGPFKFKEWIQGDRIVLEAFEDYFRGAPAIKTLTYKIITDLSTAAIALEKGEVDLYENIAEKDIPTIEANDKLEVLQEPSAVWYYLCMNNEKEPFNDVKVRQAIAKCIDKQAIVDVVADGNAEPTNSFIPKGVIGYREGFDPLPYNVDEAKQMLADAGFPDGFTSTIITPESRKDHAQLIQADLKKIGIDATIEVLEAGAFWTEVEAGNYDMSVAGWSYVSMDPDVGFYSLFQSEEIISGNYVRYNNPTVDQLLEDGRQESDAAKRTQIYEDLEDITMTEVPYVPLYWKNANVAYNKDLKGVAIPMIDMYYFYGYSW